MYDIYRSCKWTISSIWWHNFMWDFVIELSLWLIEYNENIQCRGKKPTSLQCYSNYFFTIFLITKHIFLLDIKTALFWFIPETVHRRICLGTVLMDKTCVPPPSTTVQGKPSSSAWHSTDWCHPTYSRRQPSKQTTGRIMRLPKNRKSREFESLFSFFFFNLYWIDIHKIVSCLIFLKVYDNLKFN